jgi:hypothetical protein
MARRRPYGREVPPPAVACPRWPPRQDVGAPAGGTGAVGGERAGGTCHPASHHRPSRRGQLVEERSRRREVGGTSPRFTTATTLRSFQRIRAPAATGTILRQCVSAIRSNIRKHEWKWRCSRAASGATTCCARCQAEAPPAAHRRRQPRHGAGPCGSSGGGSRPCPGPRARRPDRGRRRRFSGRRPARGGARSR